MQHLRRLWERLHPVQRQGEITQQFLIDTSVILASSLDYETTLNTVVHLATQTVADWCLIDLLNEHGTVERVAVAHHNPRKEQLVYELQRRYPMIDSRGRHTLLQVLRTAKPWFDPDVSLVRLRDEARDEAHWEMLKEIGFTSEIVVPLITRERTLGTLTLILGEGGRRYQQADLTLAEELGRRVALAIDNSRLYREAESQRKRFEAVMTRYRDLVENANDIIYTLDLGGKLTSINRAGEEITGYTREELMNTTVEQLVMPAYVDVMNRMQDRKLDSGGRTRYELEFAAKDGRVLTLEINSQLIVQDGIVTGIQGIARDITERKLAEKQAEALQAATTALYQAEQQARLEAEEADRLKLQFLAMISHELRTPLTSIKGFATTLLSDDVTWDADSQHEFLTIIDVEADKLTALIDELLDLSRFHAGKLDITPAPGQLGDIVEAAQTELKMLTQGYRLEINIPPDLPPILADSNRIIQVLTNLVSNAVKYSKLTSLIRIEARRDGEYVQVDVTDEGIGIPPAAREIVFEAFKQGKGVKKGAGLGLAICKGLIEAHGGRIWVVEREGEGTTISFTLPAASQ